MLPCANGVQFLDGSEFGVMDSMVDPEPILAIRKASPDDALACATILNRWIDETNWMPRVHPADDVERHYREWVLPKRDVYVIGQPLQGYIALDREEPFITSLYCRKRNAGLGKRLLDHAKAHHGPTLNLWTFVANRDARRFYKREGFKEVDRTDGDNEEKLPDILFRWEENG